MNILLALLALCFGLTSAQTTIQIQAGPQCPSPWVQSVGDKCLLFRQTVQTTFSDAATQCQLMQGALLAVSSLAEHNIIATYLSQNANPSTDLWYTSGLSDSTTPGRFVWQTGKAVVSPDLNSVWITDLTYYLQPQNVIYLQNLAVTYGTDNVRWGFILADMRQPRPFICQASVSVAQMLVAMQRDFSYGVSDLNNVPMGPHFTMQPSYTIYMQQSSNPVVTLECRATGNPLPTYTWYQLSSAGTSMKVDPLLASQSYYATTNGKLTITMNANIFSTAVGTYQCAATNSLGTALSNPALIDNGYIDNIDKTPRASVTANAYSWITLSCNPPNHYPDVKFSWYLGSANNFIFTQYYPYIFISQNSNLYFSMVTKTDQGTYYCVVSPTVASVASQKGPPTPLNVVQAIYTVQEPVFPAEFPAVYPSTNLIRGINATLECFAYGTCTPQLPLSYTWSRVDANNNPIKIPGKAILSDWNRIMNIPNIQIEDGGTYICTVTRPAGSSTKKSLSVNVQAAPFFTMPLTDNHADAASTVTFQCTAIGVPAVTYSWYYNGVLLTRSNLPDATRFLFGGTTSGSANSNKLVINNVQSSDAGMYQCAATNPYGSVLSTGQLRVLQFAPNFLKNPITNLEEGIGGNVTIYCLPEAAPTPTITWAFNGTSFGTLPSATVNTGGYFDCPSGVCVLPLSDALYLTALSDQRTGYYTCTATNSLGTASSTGLLRVVTAPAFVRSPASLRVTVNSTFTMQCGTTVPYGVDATYLWQINGINLNFDRLSVDARKIWSTVFRQGGIYNFGDLIVSNIGFDYMGWYVCQVLTAFGRYSLPSFIDVIGPPGPPAGVRATTTGAYNATLSWSVGALRGSTMLSYIIEAQDIYSQQWVIVATNILEPYPAPTPDTGQRSATVQNLAPYTSYAFRVRGVNIYGIGMPSAASEQYLTSPAVPRIYPANLTGGDGKVGTLNISWTPLARAEWGAPSGSYIVTYLAVSNVGGTPAAVTVAGGFNASRLTVVVGGGQTIFRQPYWITIQAVNAQGSGPISPRVVIYSAEQMPAYVVTNVRANSFNATAIEVFWDPVPGGDPNIKGTIRGFRVGYWLAVGQTITDSKRQTVFGNVNTAMVLALHTDAYYWFNVQLFNGAGNGPPSTQFQQKTWRLPPQNYPLNVKVNRTATDSVLVTWIGVTISVLEETLDGYIMRYWVEGADLRTATDVDCYRNTYGTLKGLSTNTYYNLRVFGYSRGGHGKMSFLTQFILSSACINGAYDTLDVRYIYICAAGALTPLHSVLIAALLVTFLLNRR